MDVDSMEGFSVSHAGDEISLYWELETITMAKTRQLDTHDRSGQIARLVVEWASQYDDLTNAFLTSLSPFINVSLLHNGCIGSSPTRPTVAITICTLDMFRQSHRVCPRFSIHPAAKMLCFMHNLCYCRHLAKQMRTAFNVYLEIHRRINSRLDKFLGHDTENWRMLISCPACQYKLVNEPTLDFLILCACDGNNSAKLVDPTVCSGEEHLDPRSGLSSIWLTESYIDQFKDEQPSDPDDPWIDELDSNDSAEPPTICIDRWRNAAPESRKKMFAIFKKSGISVTVCRHGFLLTICDMVRSGELYFSSTYLMFDMQANTLTG
ncbi:hypothetical protein DFJ58DRAFT_717006 [Suillus subalutaceus]|uniref:uncharacterized protein n=1 Tax=Suillus subalutaceus TaxID=48586 RepID=UPI001B85C4F3|nr:uncharacterized protein DFJ58DRAFT_717006 [Suillus subalutaceus]KAG1848699.1 hypothetical protein DFJ58DRAFT_717006 [Suillus subalutaceus]